MFGVPGVNGNGEKLNQLCVERSVVAWNTCFKKKVVHNHTWVSKIYGERTLIEYVIVRRIFMDRLKNVMY